MGKSGRKLRGAALESVKIDDFHTFPQTNGSGRGSQPRRSGMTHKCASITNAPMRCHARSAGAIPLLVRLIEPGTSHDVVGNCVTALAALSMGAGGGEGARMAVQVGLNGLNGLNNNNNNNNTDTDSICSSSSSSSSNKQTNKQPHPHPQAGAVPHVRDILEDPDSTRKARYVAWWSIVQY
jgi:hypothetical protein